MKYNQAKTKPLKGSYDSSVKAKLKQSPFYFEPTIALFRGDKKPPPGEAAPAPLGLGVEAAPAPAPLGLGAEAAP